jgi:6-phosphogluconolactonase
MRIEVLDDPAAAVADLLADAAAAGGHVVLTGGSSPKRAYELAAARGDDWSGATVWYGDERCVPPDHEWSNHAMAEAALLSRLDPGPEVVRMQGELGHDAGADDYERVVRERLGDAPRWDLLLLGLGPDSHTASLFPGRPEVEVTDRLVTGVPEAGMEPQVPRITLTLPALNAARRAVFLVTGESKREAVRRAFGDAPDQSSPASHVRPAELTVYLDPAAAP